MSAGEGVPPRTRDSGTDRDAAGAFGLLPPAAEPPAAGRTSGTPDTQSVPRQVRRHSVRDQVLQALRTALAEGELVPGEVYSGPALGRHFGVSATHVREAMHRLAVEGCVEIVPNRGFLIVERDTTELAELAEIRALIEVPVLLRIATTEPAPQWQELRSRAERCAAVAATADRHVYEEHDRAFHRALLSLGGNQQLVLVSEDLRRRCERPYDGTPGAHRAELLADAAQHLALLDALAARDLPAVAALAREHIIPADG